MTNSLSFQQLAVLTLRDPRTAGEIVLSWNLSKEALWTAIALVGVIVTILAGISNMVMPLPAPLETIGQSPFLYLAIAIGGFLATVHAVYWTGRMLGGRGELHEFMVLLLWLQTLRAVAQAVILTALIVAPMLGSFIALFVGVATLWVFVNFINVGLRFDSLWRSVFVLIVGAIAFMVGLSFLLSLLGVSAVGVPLNV